LGMGNWGLVIGDWRLGPTPNPQTPIPNPQSPIPMKEIKIFYSFRINSNNKKIFIKINK